MKVFDMPIKTEPRWKFWLANLFGRTIHKEGGLVFKKWRGAIWVLGKFVGYESDIELQGEILR